MLGSQDKRADNNALPDGRARAEKAVPPGDMPSVKDMGVLGKDRMIVQHVLAKECEITHRRWRDQWITEKDPRISEAWFEQFQLRYTGEKPVEVGYLGADARIRKAVISNEKAIAIFEVKRTNYFPNRLISRLVRIHDEGLDEEGLYSHMHGFYARLKMAIPPYGIARSELATVRKDPGDFSSDERKRNPHFPDENLMLLWMSSDDCTRGLGVPKMLVGAVLGSDYAKGCEYAVVYTRMAGFSKDAGRLDVAPPNEVFDYFRKVKAEGWSDWSVRFHANAGARILFPLPFIARDSQSRDAGAFAVYDIKRLFESGFLERPKIPMRELE